MLRLSWRQAVVLEAASRVDHLPFRAQLQANIEYGVWRSLVSRGLLRHVSGGWAITGQGRALVHYGIDVLNNERKERLLMDGKLPRYRVSRTLHGWAVLDRFKSNAIRDQDIVETFRSRHSARLKAYELNQQLLQEKNTGDAA